MCGRVPKTVRIEMTDSPTSTKPYEVLPRGGGILIQPVDGGPEVFVDIDIEEPKALRVFLFRDKHATSHTIEAKIALKDK